MIRKIQKEDASYIKDIVEKSLGYEANSNIIEKNIETLNKDSSYYIAVYEDKNKKVTGFIQAEKYSVIYGGNGWNIIELAVLPEMQNKGIGKALLISAEEHSKNNNGTFVRLNSRIDRVDSHGFYEHLGYQCDKIQKRFIKYF